MHVKDKVCVVTGAASGIGEAVARAYAQAGARGVVVAGPQDIRRPACQRSQARSADLPCCGCCAGDRDTIADRRGRNQIWARRRVLLQRGSLAQGQETAMIADWT